MKWTIGYILLIIVGCRTEPRTNIIAVEISPKKLVLEKRDIEMHEFESELKFIVNIKLKEGFKEDDLTVNVKVDDNTTRGDIVDLETCMRRANLKKVMYSTINDEPQGLFKLE